MTFARSNAILQDNYCSNGILGILPGSLTASLVAILKTLIFHSKKACLAFLRMKRENKTSYDHKALTPPSLIPKI